MKAIQKELDKLVQMLCIDHRCDICGCRAAEAVHHIIGRSNDLLRYDFSNLLPVCYECHRNIHDKGLEVSKYIHPDRWQYLQQIKNKSYKDVLTFDLGMSEAEFLKDCRSTLRRVTSEKY